VSETKEKGYEHSSVTELVPIIHSVEYSTHIDGDLSRFANSKDFNLEMQKVVDESWRYVLQHMHRRNWDYYRIGLI
jgi:hypothetical protein